MKLVVISKTILTAMTLCCAALMAGCMETSEGANSKQQETKMTRTNNHIDYVEFAAEDLEAVKAFYGKAFGWEFQDWGPEYISFTGAGIEGGFRGGEKPLAGGALVILYAEDLDKSEANVVAAGGEITERHEFPGGKRFHFRDPAGNVLGVWVIVEEAE